MTESENIPLALSREQEKTGLRTRARAGLKGLADSARQATQQGSEALGQWLRGEAELRLKRVTEDLHAVVRKFSRQEAGAILSNFVQDDLGADEKLAEAVAQQVVGKLENSDPEPLEPADLVLIDEIAEQSEATSSGAKAPSAPEGGLTQQAAKLNLEGRFEASAILPPRKKRWTRTAASWLIVAAAAAGSGYGVYEFGPEIWKAVTGGIKGASRNTLGQVVRREAVAREERSEKLGVSMATYENRRYTAELIASGEGGKMIPIVLGWFTNIAGERSVIEDSKNWLPDMKTDMEIILEGLSVEKISPDQLAEKLTNLYGKEAAVGSELLGVLVKMQEENKPMSNYDAYFESNKEVFGKFWQDKNGDGKVGVIDVLIGYWEDYAGVDWFESVSSEQYIPDSNLEELVDQLPGEITAGMSRHEWTRFSAFVLPKYALADEGYRAAQKLGERMQRTVASKARHFRA